MNHAGLALKCGAVCAHFAHVGPTPGRGRTAKSRFQGNRGARIIDATFETTLEKLGLG
jgi:hypothetical protein